MGTITPTWTDNVSVISAQVLARGSTLRGTLDLRSKIGARLFIRLGRGGTTALGTAATLLVRPVVNNDAAGGVHPAPSWGTQTSTAAANSTTVSSDSNAGQAVLTVASGTGFAAGQIICIQDNGGGVTRLEWARISKISGGTITLDRNLTYTHTSAQADTVRNQADVFIAPFIDGGTLYEVIVDYGAAGSGESLTVQVLAQTYDVDTTA
jgi:hypothetical protein